MPTEVLALRDATDPPGTLGDEQSDDPVALAEWLAAFDALPAMIAPPEDAGVACLVVDCDRTGE